MKNLDKTYSPKEFENKIYKKWEDNNFFHAEINKEKKPFTIMMPPPNVTGKLHIGHALGDTIQDIFIRVKRMQGYEALWMPGMDHASISTESKVVERLKSQGLEKKELGREKFLDEAWKWTHEYGGEIKNQLKKLGVSCDWERERFTLDEGLSDAVAEQFIKMYKDDLIYQGYRIVNFCINCETAISDAEVEHIEEEGSLYFIKYPVENEEAYIEIATTRPETMLGDLAVAVNPEDERYEKFKNKTLILPLVERKIPVIEDDYVMKEFGSGAVKITPSHDPNDFEVGQRHDLGQCKVIMESGNIAEGYGKYTGLERFEARKQIIKDLEEKGLLVKIEKNVHSVGHCERCSTIIEPLISKQWFVKMKDLAKRAKDVYVDGEINIIPDRFGKIYVNWLDNIRDWCISRQLWWGHRIPVYYCDNCSEIVVEKTKPEICPNCSEKNFYQDEDTLDTWFSSALWPFSTLGWPEKTKELEYFYPTDVLVTAGDIVFFWVIRMVFSSLYSMDEIPFKDVYFTGLVRDDQGRKMSKTLGNGIDPLEIIDNYGADALRFTLISGNSPGNDMRFYMEKVEANRNFANKLWNASRFVFMNIEDDINYLDIEVEYEIEDKWILSKLHDVIKKVSDNLEKKEIGLAANTIYNFVWTDYCDWYIELVKKRLYGETSASKNTAIKTLMVVLENILKLLHPFMPFITEEINEYLPTNNEMLIVSNWPEENDFIKDEDSIEGINLLTEIISQIRNIRNIRNIPNKKKSEIIAITNDDKIINILNQIEEHILNLGFGTKLTVFNEDIKSSNEHIILIFNNLKVLLPLSELIDMNEEKLRLESEKKKLESEIERASKKLSNEKYIQKAPKDIVEKEQTKLKEYQDKYEVVCKNIDELKI